LYNKREKAEKNGRREKGKNAAQGKLHQKTKRETIISHQKQEWNGRKLTEGKRMTKTIREQTQKREW